MESQLPEQYFLTVSFIHGLTRTAEHYQRGVFWAVTVSAANMTSGRETRLDDPTPSVPPFDISRTDRPTSTELGVPTHRNRHRNRIANGCRFTLCAVC